MSYSEANQEGQNKQKVTKITKLAHDLDSYEICSDENPWLGRFIWCFANICFIMAEYLIITVIFIPLIAEGQILWLTIPCLLINVTS